MRQLDRRQALRPALLARAYIDSIGANLSPLECALVSGNKRALRCLLNLGGEHLLHQINKAGGSSQKLCPPGVVFNEMSCRILDNWLSSQSHRGQKRKKVK